MFCATCGEQVQTGAHFCESCGAQLGMAAAVTNDMPTRGRRSYTKIPDPYKEQITQLRLEIKQLKLYLKRVTTDMANTRAQYHETAAFVPHGVLKRGYKWFEDFRLLGPQQQKQQLQEQILQLEQQLLGLQQAQAQWKMQQGG